MNEVWKPVVGYEGLYEVSDLGRVRSLDHLEEVSNRWGTTTTRLRKGKILKPVFDGKCNYLHVTLSGCCKNVHRLVAQAFVPNPNQYDEVNHKDDDKTNNNATNLEWCTHIYNNNYGHRLVSSKGSNNGMSKLTEEMVREIKEKSAYMRTKDLAKEYGISETQISAIKHGRRWRWL